MVFRFFLRVSPDGVRTIIYGAVGVEPPEDGDRLTWRWREPNSIVSLGQEILVGTERGLIWLSVSSVLPTTTAYRERWLLPPSESLQVLLALSGIVTVR